MKVISVLLLGLLFSFDVAVTHPIHLATDHANTLATDPESVVGGRNPQRNPQRNPLECDACMFLANGINQTIIHNPKVVSFVTTDIEEICKVLPASVQQLCLSAAEQSVPNLLNNLGDFIAKEGCSDLGICHTKYS